MQLSVPTDDGGVIEFECADTFVSRWINHEIRVTVRPGQEVVLPPLQWVPARSRLTGPARRVRPARSLAGRAVLSGRQGTTLWNPVVVPA